MCIKGIKNVIYVCIRSKKSVRHAIRKSWWWRWLALFHLYLFISFYTIPLQQQTFELSILFFWWGLLLLPHIEFVFTMATAAATKREMRGWGTKIYYLNQLLHSKCEHILCWFYRHTVNSPHTVLCLWFFYILCVSMQSMIQNILSDILHGMYSNDDNRNYE